MWSKLLYDEPATLQRNVNQNKFKLFARAFTTVSNVEALLFAWNYLCFSVEPFSPTILNSLMSFHCSTDFCAPQKTNYSVSWVYNVSRSNHPFYLAFFRKCHNCFSIVQNYYRFSHGRNVHVSNLSDPRLA